MRIHSAMALLFLASVICLGGCSGQAPLLFPELPRKDWLGEEKSAPVQKVDAIYSPDKRLTFTDLVYLAIQQSPVLERSSVNMDIQQIALTSARWKALPEVHLIAVISNNLTQYNQGKLNKNAQKDYGKTKYQISYTGVFNNPVATYFDVQAQKELMSIAIATHKNVIGKCINQIADLLVQIRAKEAVIASLKDSLEIARRSKGYADASSAYKADIWNGPDAQDDIVRDRLLQVDTAHMELTILRNQLKLLVGVDRNQQLLLDTNSVVPAINSFVLEQLSWEDCWEKSTDRYLLAQQVRLHDAGIMLAWAQYVPNISFVVNESPPNGQAQPANAETDQFLHVSLNFPLLDWGLRYRNAEQSRAKKRQSRLDEIIKRREYQQRWFMAEDQLKLSRARLRQCEHALGSAEKRLKAVQISFDHGGSSMPELSRAQQAVQDARMARVNAEAAVLKNQLGWLDLSQSMQNSFLENASGEER